MLREGGLLRRKEIVEAERGLLWLTKCNSPTRQDNTPTRKDNSPTRKCNNSTRVVSLARQPRERRERRERRETEGERGNGRENEDCATSQQLCPGAKFSRKIASRGKLRKWKRLGKILAIIRRERGWGLRAKPKRDGEV